MNIGYPCKCGSRRVHAVLRKWGTMLSVEICCLKCGNNYDEALALDGLDWIDWKRFREIYETKVKPLKETT